MVVTDFPLDFAGFFPLWKIPVCRGKIPVPPEKNQVKNTVFFEQTAPKRHSSLFLCTFLCRNTHVPTAQPALSCPCPHPCPTYLMWLRKYSSQMSRLCAMLEYLGSWHFSSKIHRTDILYTRKYPARCDTLQCKSRKYLKLQQKQNIFQTRLAVIVEY